MPGSQLTEKMFKCLETNGTAIKITKDRGTQREYSSKPLKHGIVKRILAFKW